MNLLVLDDGKTKPETKPSSTRKLSKKQKKAVTKRSSEPEEKKNLCLCRAKIGDKHISTVVSLFFVFIFRQYFNCYYWNLFKFLCFGWYYLCFCLAPRQRSQSISRPVHGIAQGTYEHSSEALQGQENNPSSDQSNLITGIKLFLLHSLNCLSKYLCFPLNILVFSLPNILFSFSTTPSWADGIYGWDLSQSWRPFKGFQFFLK